ncbi:peptidylprolyl isomerase [Phenylobacterium sp.]|jgi:peptidyl-prolyl cis-trans isomerase A (cyclophilin A)|uniref:peptidylprolyl isomerase n=1 Tax=Phenylobacterium sp. TaxID=1871053 RepID=UPI002E313F36|nr:peptidylprolyl isomerase [Phenylobacterium sp.]HEX3367067.1 peptidylprolyl isomerase [Phenylobacterium sp.]
MLLRRTLLALAAAASLAATSAHAQSPTNPRVVITTTEGVITVELYPDKAPITVANFLKYVDRKLYDGATFYRASKPPGQAANDYGAIQGGLRDDVKKKLPPIAHESTLKTGIKHTDGAISMGRYAPGTAQADWVICIGDMTYLDATATDPGFAAFGRMTDGKPVAEAILGKPTDPNAGVGAMKGEILVHPVKIISIRRAPPPDPASPPPAAAPEAAPPAPTPATTPKA